MRLRAVQTLVLGVAIGLAVGICAYTFAYAQGWSYLTDNAAACANCHVMREQYDGWLKSSTARSRSATTATRPQDSSGSMRPRSATESDIHFISRPAATKTTSRSSRTAVKSRSRPAASATRRSLWRWKAHTEMMQERGLRA